MTKIKNDYTHWMTISMDGWDENYKRHTLYQWQKEISRRWKKAFCKEAIIVIEAVNMKTAGVGRANAQLVKLNLSQEEIEGFISICNEVCEPDISFVLPPPKKRGRKIAQYDKDGNFIREWDNQSVAAKALGLNQGCLCDVVNGHKTSTKGMYFRYVEE